MTSYITHVNRLNNAIERPIARFLGIKQIWVSWAMFFFAYGLPIAAYFWLN